VVGQTEYFQSGYFGVEGARGKKERDERANRKPVETGVIE